MTPLSLREHVAEPANLWIRHSFSRWPLSSGRLWCDLTTGGLPPGASALPVEPLQAADLVRSLADVVYVPPVPVTEEQLRSHVAAAAAEVGVPLLLQVSADFDVHERTLVVDRPAAGRDAAGSTADGAAEVPAQAVVVVDLLDCLVRHAVELRSEFKERRQPGLPFAPRPLAGANVVWPLVAGWTDRPALLEPAMARLAAAGAGRVVARAMHLGARDRRFLCERLQSTWPEAFDSLFHGGDVTPAAAPFHEAATAAGLGSRLPRPLPARPLPPRLRRARQLAGHLIELGDAADAQSDAYYRAARFLDRGEVDIDAAAREGNLGVLPWLGEPARRAVERWLTAQPRGC